MCLFDNCFRIRTSRQYASLHVVHLPKRSETVPSEHDKGNASFKVGTLIPRRKASISSLRGSYLQQRNQYNSLGGAQNVSMRN